MDLNIYLTFNGDAEEAMNFYAQALDTKIEFIQRFGDMPSPDANPADANRLMHARMSVKGVGLMASDTHSNDPVTFGQNTSISINCDNNEEADKAFNALSAGGTVTLPMQEMFWGAYFGMCTDKFGVQWMFNHDHPQNNS